MRETTKLELFMVCAFLFLGIVFLLSCCTGCATQRPPMHYTVDKGFDVIVDTPERIQALWEAVGNDSRDVGGFINYSTRTIYVEYGRDGLPNFEYLGHELWHLPELGGMFHK